MRSFAKYFECIPELCGNALPELLGESDQESFGAADVAEPIRVFVLDHFADKLRAALAESARVSSISSTANMIRRYPRAFTGAFR